MMGDNRPDSEDSRFWGPVPKRVDHRQGIPDLLAADRIGLPLAEIRCHADSTTKAPKSTVKGLIELVVTVAVAVASRC